MLCMDKEAPIGVLDSGVGGISVLRELIALMPQESFVFYGDSLHAPYGVRPRDEVLRLVFDGVGQLMQYHIKALVVACNTATGVAIGALRERYPSLPIVGIEPAVKPAVRENPHGKILVMATPVTLQQENLKALLHRFEEDAQIVPIPCEGLMNYVEKGILDGEELETYLRNKLSPHLPAQAIVLGCTHYPFVKDVIARVALAEAEESAKKDMTASSHSLTAGEPEILDAGVSIARVFDQGGVRLYDGGPGTARETRRRLMEGGLLREQGENGDCRICNSIGSEQILTLSEQLLNV